MIASIATVVKVTTVINQSVVVKIRVASDCVNVVRCIQGEGLGPHGPIYSSEDESHKGEFPSHGGCS